MGIFSRRHEGVKGEGGELPHLNLLGHGQAVHGSGVVSDSMPDCGHGAKPFSTGESVRGASVGVLHDANHAHASVSKRTNESGKARRKVGKNFPHLHDTLSKILHVSLSASFASWRGGTKALSAVTERAPRTAQNWMSGKTVMGAVDMLMAAVRCPHFRDELRRRLEALDRGVEMVKGAAKRGAGRVTFRLRFRRRSLEASA